MSDSLDPQVAADIRASVGLQQIMRTIGATLDTIASGRAEISLPFRAANR